MKVIFDLDGTLFDIEHRVHHAEAGNWDKFFAECDNDTPIMDTILTLEAMKDAGIDIVFLTGRSEKIRRQTLDMIASCTSIKREDIDLSMRAIGDRRRDDIVKMDWFTSKNEDYQQHVIAVFEDRSRVVKMWRRIGVTCYQVAEGDF